MARFEPTIRPVFSNDPSVTSTKLSLPTSSHSDIVSRTSGKAVCVRLGRLYRSNVALQRRRPDTLTSRRRLHGLWLGAPTTPHAFRRLYASLSPQTNARQPVRLAFPRSRQRRQIRRVEPVSKLCATPPNVLPADRQPQVTQMPHLKPKRAHPVSQRGHPLACHDYSSCTENSPPSLGAHE